MCDNSSMAEITSALAEEISKKVAENIRFERKKAGLTQTELGVRIGVR